MNKRQERQLVLAAAWGFVLTGLVLISQQTLRADENKAADPPASQLNEAELQKTESQGTGEAGSRRQLRIELRGNVPLFDKIPMVKTLVGTVFDQSTDGHDTEKTCPSGCLEHCESAESKFAEICENLVVVKKSKCSESALGCQECPAHARQVSHDACEQIAELKTEIAALQSRLEAREEIHSARQELFQQVLGLMNDRAKLEARLELVATEKEAQERIRELMAENARLKSALELAEMRQSMLKQSMEVAIENEKLRVRVAELEQRTSIETEARTAKKEHADHPPQARLRSSNLPVER